MPAFALRGKEDHKQHPKDGGVGPRTDSYKRDHARAALFLWSIILFYFMCIIIIEKGHNTSFESV